MAIVANALLTAIGIGSGLLLSGMLFGPGDVPRQLFIVAPWFFIGFVTCAQWMR